MKFTRLKEDDLLATTYQADTEQGFYRATYDRVTTDDTLDGHWRLVFFGDATAPEDGTVLGRIQVQTGRWDDCEFWAQHLSDKHNHRLVRAELELDVSNALDNLTVSAADFGRAHKAGNDNTRHLAYVLSADAVTLSEVAARYSTH